MALTKSLKENDTVIIADGNAVTVSNLNKVYWPKDKYTKGNLIQYYQEIAPYILPYLKDRPMVLNRFPNGIDGEHFFQKNTSNLHLPKWIKTIDIQHEKDAVSYIIIQNEATLLYVINLGCIELNPFNSLITHLDKPDYIVIDLDPEDIDFEHVIDTANTVHEILDKVQIPSYCKTSGGRGLHIYIPLGGKYTYEQGKQLAHLIATVAHQHLPDITSLERLPSKRQQRVYLDIHQNDRTKTLASVYCVRPKPGAPVSTPLKWSEVKPGLDPKAFTIETIQKRLKKTGDLFQPVLGKGIDLLKALQRFEKRLG